MRHTHTHNIHGTHIHTTDMRTHIHTSMSVSYQSQIPQDIIKLKKKITNAVQVLTHLKQKLQFVQVENCSKKERLKQIESVVAQKRDLLTRTKQTRDALRMNNNTLRHKGGLVSHSTLLRDFEERKDQVIPTVIIYIAITMTLE